jgi:hypothetical protein
MFIRSALSGLLFLCLCACSGGTSPASPSAGIPIPSDTASPDPTATSTLTPEPTPAARERPLYQIDAAIDTRLTAGGDGDTMTLTVKEQAIYTNHTAVAIPDLVLQIEPARSSGLFELLSLSVSRPAQITPPAIANGQLRIPLDAPLAPGETVAVRLEYRRRIAQENTAGACAGEVRGTPQLPLRRFRHPLRRPGRHELLGGCQRG